MSSAGIGVVGLGYVGLPLALALTEAGYRVLGFDIDAEKCARLNRGESYIRHIDATTVRAAVSRGGLRATWDFSEVSEVAAVLICVPTPLDADRHPDLQYVLETGRQIAPHLQRGALVVLESTTYPGTTEDVLRPVLEKGSGMEAGRDFHLAYSPEREDPGNPASSTRTIPKVIGGLTPQCRERAMEVYSRAVETLVPVESCRVAEMSKLLENVFRSVNIALVNELKMVCDRMGIDIWQVIDAAKTKPFGFMPFYPGPGLGGHCIPIDPFYLAWKARQFGVESRFIELAGEVNTGMPGYVLAKVEEALSRAGQVLAGSRVLLLGLAYKPNVDDDRESPAYVLMELLEARGAVADYHDPFVPEIQVTRHFPQFAGRRSQEISNRYDLLLVVTAHDVFRDIDWSRFDIPIVDTRNLVSQHPQLTKA